MAPATMTQTTHRDVTDYVNVDGGGFIGQVLSESGGARVFVKSGPAKPKLEGLSKAQWSLANLVIFNKLGTENELDRQNIL